jgi:hypothetical protein
MSGANDRPVYRYSDAQMATIRDLIDARDPGWLDAVWDPILLDAHGCTLAQASERGVEVRVCDFGIPWEQSTTISGWLAGVRGGHRFTWLSYGPSPVRPGD